MNDIMLDLETMGNGPQAAIIAIGAVEFDVVAQEIGEKFYTVVDLASAVESGGVIDTSTVLWWIRQSDKARAEIVGPGQHIDLALLLFAYWMQQRGDRPFLRVWGNGADFDNVILASAYRNGKKQQPWEWFNNRCYRTVKNLYPHIVMQRVGAHHKAVDDAESQAVHLLRILAADAVPVAE